MSETGENADALARARHWRRIRTTSLAALAVCLIASIAAPWLVTALAHRQPLPGLPATYPIVAQGLLVVFVLLVLVANRRRNAIDDAFRRGEE